MSDQSIVSLLKKEIAVNGRLNLDPTKTAALVRWIENAEAAHYELTILRNEFEQLLKSLKTASK